MVPENVFVVYNSYDEAILSVHPTKDLAIKAKYRAVDALRGREHIDLLELRFVITTLTEAILWISSPSSHDLAH